MSSSRDKRNSLLHELDQAIGRMTGQSILLSASVAAVVGLNSTDLECLDVIRAKGVATAGDLATGTGLTTGAITSVIDRLEKAGYVRREPDPSDRRKVLLRLQPKSATIEALYAPLRTEMLSLWSEYDDDQIALVVDFMQKSYALATAQVADLQSHKSTKLGGHSPIDQD